MGRLENRREAGQLLAEKLMAWRGKNPVVLALPRGGLPVAAEIASALQAPLDILAVKKIGAPGRPELAIGAVSEDGVPVLNPDLVRVLDADRVHLKRAAKAKVEEMRRQLAAYRQVRALLPVKDRCVILVDDGLATGATMEAAVQVLGKRGAREIVIAVPVASREAVEKLRDKVDEVFTLLVPEEFFSVGLWYQDFSEVTDEEALALLKNRGNPAESQEREISLSLSSGLIFGDLFLPKKAKAVILFAHESGSSRKSARNRYVAEALQEEGFATLLLDLLTEREASDPKNVFDIGILAERLILAKKWLNEHHPSLAIGYFGASTGAAAALQAAAQEPAGVFALVSRGGRPDLALASWKHVAAPTLLLVGGDDAPVIPLNRAAADRISHAHMVIIPGAGHLFEERGKLEEVLEYSLDWFTQHLPEKGAILREPKRESVREILRLARPLKKDADLRALAEELADSRVVMLGEATHGTHEFYEIRRKLSQILLEDHHFNFIAVEGDWPDCYGIHRYVQRKNAKGLRAVLEGFERWPTWMWANEEVAQLAEWMHAHRGGFFGLDVYSLFESIDVIRKVAKRFGSEAGTELLRRYSCFEPYERDEVAYAKSLLRFPEGCRDEAIQNLQDLLKIRLEDTRLTEEELFNAQQNARVVKNAETYYRAMLKGDSSSWNVRDRHMMETLKILLHHHGPASKAIVWAHNTHIGDYRATSMVEEGYVNIGGLAREEFGAEHVALVGFGTYGGSVLAGKAWGAPEEVMKLPNARAGSIEDDCHRAVRQLRSSQFYLCFDKESERGALGRTQGHRAVGVVYSPAYEISGHNYVPTKLAERYDAFVFVDQTSALQSLHPVAQHGLFPETWPSGF